MTFFVMAPTFDRAWQNGLKPMMDNTISQQEAYVAVTQPFREFMLGQVRDKDLNLFEDLSEEAISRSGSRDDRPAPAHPRLRIDFGIAARL